MAKVLSMAEKTNNGTLRSPADALNEALLDLQTDLEFQPNKLVVIMLDDRYDAYGTRFIQAGMKMSELVALLEVAKHNVIVDQMGL